MKKGRKKSKRKGKRKGKKVGAIDVEKLTPKQKMEMRRMAGLPDKAAPTAKIRNIKCQSCDDLRAVLMNLRVSNADLRANLSTTKMNLTVARLENTKVNRLLDIISKLCEVDKLHFGVEVRIAAPQDTVAPEPDKNS